jgi:type I restriction enzyme S subunit
MIREKEFKDSPTSMVPRGWNVVRLGDVISLFHNGTWGEEPVPREVSYPVIRSTEITHDGRIDLSSIAFRKIADGGVDKYALKEGDILLVASSGSSNLIGRAAQFKKPSDGKMYLFSNFMIRIRPKNVVSEYLFYHFSSQRYHQFLKALQQTSTGLRNLPKKEFIEFKLPLPPLPEQRKIASILSTVDEAIQRVDEAIACTERLKRGLMQRLLTRGMGHKEFKFSKELGCEIPKEWEVVRLEDISTEITDGSHFSPKEDQNGTYRIATVADISEDKIDINTCKKISKEDYEMLVRNGCKPKKGDILFSKDGTVGLSFSFKQDDDLVLLSSIAIISPKENLHSDYCAYVLKSPPVFRQIIGSKRGTGLRRVILQDLKRIKIPLPPLPEQRKIAEIMAEVDKKLELEKSRKQKLGRIKKGLMNDLLTGKKRIKIEG